MKNQDKKKELLAIPFDYPANKKETIFPMEIDGQQNIPTDQMEDELMGESHRFDNFLNYIAFEQKLNCMFTPFGFFGIKSDIEKTRQLLINSVKYN